MNPKLYVRILFVLCVAILLSACDQNVQGQVSLTPYDDPVEGQQYTYRVTAILRSDRPVSYNKIVGFFNAVEVSKTIPRGAENQVFQLETSNYTKDLLQGAKDTPVLLVITFYLNDQVVAGPFFATIPTIDNLPPEGIQLNFELKDGARGMGL